MLYSPQSWKKAAQKRKKSALTKWQSNAIDANGFKTKKIKNEQGLKKLWRFFVKTAVIIFCIGLITLTGAFFWFSRDLPKSTELLTKNPIASTKIYDRTGQVLLNNVNSDFKRIKIKLSDLPEYVKWSAIVAEDKQFYSHRGINFKGVLRAIFIDIMRGGSTSQGGSSISQQFIKNALLTSEKTLVRKIKEAILTWQLERKFTKDQILEMYFNEIPYGGTAYGIEAATEKYFNKSAKDLNLAEAATLAAIPQAPSLYSPFGTHKDRLLARKDWVLNSLADEGYITRAEADEAKKQQLNFSQISSSSIIAPHFVFYIRDLIAEKYGEKTLTEGGLKIITTLDMAQQKTAEKAIKNQLEKNTTKYNAKNAAIVALNPKTGEITAMVGSTDYFDEKNDGAVNVALSPRQPGSSFKPLVYANAFEKGYSPQTMLFDLLTTFKVLPENYTPHNYSDHYFGPVSMKKALAGSLNVPAVKTMYLVGVENILNLAEKIGYTTFSDRSRFGLSIVLGGGEVKLLEHAVAYATYANEGIYHAPFAILKIEDKDGKILEENKPENNLAKKIFEPQIIRELTDILSDNNERAYIFGAKNYLTLADRPVAAKTGTTNDYKDAWTLGYTPSLVAGVWVGNTDGEKMKTAADGSAVAAPIWNEFMKKTLANTPIEQFAKPDEIILPNKPMLNGEFYHNVNVRIDKTTDLPAASNTPDAQTEIKSFREVHNILHYVNKNNLLSPSPDKPWELDENYNTWELAVEEWANKNGYATKINLPANWENAIVENVQPEKVAEPIKIIKPVMDEKIYEESFPYPMQVQITEPDKFKKIDFYLKNSTTNATDLIGYQNVSGPSAVFTWTTTLPVGNYLIYIIATDKNNNTTKSQEIKIERK